ncbi:MAG: carboxymuconolactone decarboxylase family protein [Planctomycetes bacterium]|nr:carboxymuconolactone decarboxylase family protein [Planctomycetota bacterium]
MAWIRTVPPSEAQGDLARSYRAAMGRAGQVAGIIQAMSLSPSILDASMGLYLKIMYAPGGLSRIQREMLATVVSQINDCHY